MLDLQGLNNIKLGDEFVHFQAFLYLFVYLINRRISSSQIISASEPLSDKRKMSAIIKSSSLPIRLPNNEAGEKPLRNDAGAELCSSVAVAELRALSVSSVFSSDVSVAL